MRITSYKVTPIATIDPPLRAASGLHAPFALRVILEIACEDGITGFSEIPCTNGVVESLNHICKHLLGEDPLQLTRLLEKAKTSLVSLKREDEARGDSPWDQRIWVHARSALEVACLDYLGKRFEVRVCDLLGGAVREAVPFGAYLFYKEPGAGGDLAFGADDQAEADDGTMIYSMDPWTEIDTMGITVETLENILPKGTSITLTTRQGQSTETLKATGKPSEKYPSTTGFPPGDLHRIPKVGESPTQ